MSLRLHRRSTPSIIPDKYLQAVFMALHRLKQQKVLSLNQEIHFSGTQGLPK